MKKVFLTCPINIVKAYCLDDYFNSLRKLTYHSIQYYFVDNSKDENFHRELMCQYGFEIDWCNPKNRSSQWYMTASLRMCRQKFLESDCDMMFIRECDIFTPKDIIEILIAHDKTVTSACYFIGAKENSHLIQTELERTFGSYGFSYPHWKKQFINYKGQLQQTDMTGMGCLLIDRSVIEEIDFRVSTKSTSHADTLFQYDLFDAGINTYQDRSTIVKHRNADWGTNTDFKTKKVYA